MPIVRRALDPAITAALAGTVGAGAGRAAIDRQVYARGERELERQRSLQANIDQQLLSSAIRGGGGIDASGIIEHNRMIEGRKRPFGSRQSAVGLGGLGRLPRSGGRGSSGGQNDALADELDAARVDEVNARIGREDFKAANDVNDQFDKTQSEIDRIDSDTINDRRRSQQKEFEGDIDIYRKGNLADEEIDQGVFDTQKKGYQAASAHLDLQRKRDESVQRQDEVAARQAAVEGLRAHALKVQAPPALIQAATAELLGSGTLSSAMMKNLGLAPPDAGGAGAGGGGAGGGISVGARDFVKILEGGGYQAVLEASGGTNPNTEVRNADGTTKTGGGASAQANQAQAGFAAWLPRASAREIEAVRNEPGFEQSSPAIQTMVEAHLQHAQRAEAEAMAPSDMMLLQRETMKELAQIKASMGPGGAGTAPAMGAAQTMAAMSKAMGRLRREAPDAIGRIRRILDDPNFADLRDEFFRSLAGGGVQAKPDAGSVSYPDSPAPQ